MATGGIGVGGRGGAGGIAGERGAGSGQGGTDGLGGAAVKVAEVAVTQVESGTSTVVATALFYRAPETFDGTCTPSFLGDCTLYPCGKVPVGAIMTTYEAGMVSIAGFAMPISFLYDQGFYGSATFAAPLWTASTPLTAQVTGSTSVPAMTLEVIAPTPITVVAPVAAAGMPLEISKGTDLVIKWTGGVEGNSTIYLTNDEGSGVDRSIQCFAAASLGTLTVPTAFLASLGTKGSFRAGVINVTTRGLGEWAGKFFAKTMKSPMDVVYTP